MLIHQSAIAKKSSMGERCVNFHTAKIWRNGQDFKTLVNTQEFTLANAVPSRSQVQLFSPGNLTFFPLEPSTLAPVARRLRATVQMNVRPAFFFFFCKLVWCYKFKLKHSKHRASNRDKTHLSSSNARLLISAVNVDSVQLFHCKKKKKNPLSSTSILYLLSVRVVTMKQLQKDLKETGNSKRNHNDKKEVAGYKK